MAETSKAASEDVVDKASSMATDNGSNNNNNSSRNQHHHQQQPSSSSSGAASGFDCNICLELAQDPVVTLCGHLFCWPCLYRWLRGHSTCHECPVCKAVVEEDKVVPLYGRGNPNSSDPRRKPPPDASASSDIPHRPSGQRPQTAQAHNNAYHNQHQQQHPSSGFNFMAAPGGAPMAAARFGNFTFSAGFGLFPSLFGFQMHGFPDPTASGIGPGYPFGFPMGGFHGAARAYPPPPAPDQQETKLSRLFMCLGFLVVMYILFF